MMGVEAKGEVRERNGVPVEHAERAFAIASVKASAMTRAKRPDPAPPARPIIIPCRPQLPAGAPAYLSVATITCNDRGWNGASGAGDISMVNYPCATCGCLSQGAKVLWP